MDNQDMDITLNGLLTNNDKKDNDEKMQAIDETERCKIETKLLQLGGRRYYKPNEENCSFEYDYNTKSIIYRWSYTVHAQGVIYFDSISEAEEAVAVIGEKNLNKYLFGIDTSESEQKN